MANCLGKSASNMRRQSMKIVALFESKKKRNKKKKMRGRKIWASVQLPTMTEISIGESNDSPHYADAQLSPKPLSVEKSLNS
jgi:hypothetical protein